MNYELKDKITTTKELLNELEMKSWQEIEHLQTQMANLAEDSANNKLRQLFKNLLTSYYVFAGGIETLLSEPDSYNTVQVQSVPKVKTDINVEDIPVESTDEFISNDIHVVDDTEAIEPFEYFVDFDEPSGEPISDKDLYGN